MVDNVQPRSLSCFRNRKRRHENRMDLQRANKPRTSQQETGWKAPRTSPLFPVAADVFLLTFPFIERRKRRCGPGTQVTGKATYQLAARAHD